MIERLLLCLLSFLLLDTMLRFHLAVNTPSPWRWIWYKFFPPKDDGSPKNGSDLIMRPGPGKNGGRDGRVIVTDADGSNERRL